MKNIIFLVRTSKLSCDFNKLREPNATYILIGKKGIEKKIADPVLNFFDHIILLEEVNFELTDPIIEKLGNNLNSTIITPDESCVMTAALLREKYKIKGSKPKEAICFIDKRAMKEKLKKSSLRRPMYVTYEKESYQKNKELYLDEIIHKLKLPLFIKPVDSSGGINCHKIESKDRFAKWANQFFFDKHTYEIDEYIEGELYHIDSLVKDGKVLFVGIAQYSFPIYQFSKGLPLGSFLLDSTHPLWNRLEAFNKQLIQDIKAPNGATHLEVFKTPRDEIIFIEMGARPPGALIPLIYQKNLGLDFYLYHFMLELNQNPKIEIEYNSNQYSWMIFPTKEGKITKLNNPNIESPYDITWFVKVGQITKKSENYSSSNHQYSVQIIFHNKDRNILLKDFEKLKHFDPTEVE